MSLQNSETEAIKASRPTPKQISTWENDGGFQKKVEDYVLVNGNLSSGFFAQTWNRFSQYFKETEEMKMETSNLMESVGTEMAPSDGTPISIGLKESDRQSIADELSKVLADTYALYLKTQNFHWNVSGSRFFSLHQMFEVQYKQLAEAVDVIAERIRALGFWAPGSFTQFVKLTSIPEDQRVDNADEMIRLLTQGHEAVVRSLHKACLLSEKFHDEPTVDLTTQRMREHEKNAWMLRSLLN